MLRKPLDAIVRKRLKRHKTEIVLLWLILAVGAILIPVGIGIFSYVDTLAIIQYVFAIPAGNFITSQVKILCDFAKALGIVFALVGVVAVVFALDRLSLTRDAYKMASFIKTEISNKIFNK